MEDQRDNDPPPDEVFKAPPGTLRDRLVNEHGTSCYRYERIDGVLRMVPVGTPANFVPLSQRRLAREQGKG